MRRLQIIELHGQRYTSSGTRANAYRQLRGRCGLEIEITAVASWVRVILCPLGVTGAPSFRARGRNHRHATLVRATHICLYIVDSTPSYHRYLSTF